MTTTASTVREYEDSSFRSPPWPKYANSPKSGGTPEPPGISARAHERKVPRADIEGLRAVAVLAVLAYHAGLPFLPGGFVGVDVFFVISGFLITGLITSELERTGRLSFAQFYARRIKRLLPAAVVVLLFTGLGSWLLLSPVRRQAAGIDIASAAAYLANWRFAAQATDYLAADAAPSPVLHYWSLCVEEQYYLAWPLLLVAVTAAARRRGRPFIRPLGWTLAIVGFTSLALAIVTTSSAAPYAFFGTPARAWELALGGALAVGAGRLARMPNAIRIPLGWAGLAAIAVSLFVVTTQTPFPGTAALLPTLGAAAVLAAGIGQVPRLGAVALLGTAPMRATGRLSYSLYLWHWPPLVFAGALLGRQLSAWEGVAITLLAVVPAYASYRWVEEPLRHSKALVAVPWRAGVLAVVATLVVALAGAGVIKSASVSVEVQATDSTGEVTTVSLDPLAASEDLSIAYEQDCYRGYHEDDLRSCVYGDPAADRRMVIFGDSHAIQWLPALDLIGQDQGWAVELQAKAACSPASMKLWDGRLGDAYTTCDTWRERALTRMTSAGERPDLVLISGRYAYRALSPEGRRVEVDASQPALQQGLERTYQRLRAAGIPVVVIADTPYPRIDVPTCLGEHGADLAACTFPKAKAVAADPPDARAADAVKGVEVVDLTEEICPERRCQPVVDGLIAYRDSHHLTASFAESLAPALTRALSAAGVRL